VDRGGLSAYHLKVMGRTPRRFGNDLVAIARVFALMTPAACITVADVLAESGDGGAEGAEPPHVVDAARDHDSHPTSKDAAPVKDSSGSDGSHSADTSPTDVFIGDTGNLDGSSSADHASPPDASLHDGPNADAHHDALADEDQATCGATCASAGTSCGNGRVTVCTLQTDGCFAEETDACRIDCSGSSACACTEPSDCANSPTGNACVTAGGPGENHCGCSAASDCPVDSCCGDLGTNGPGATNICYPNGTKSGNDTCLMGDWEPTVGPG
jgi:hypothetical protein